MRYFPLLVILFVFETYFIEQTSAFSGQKLSSGVNNLLSKQIWAPFFTAAALLTGVPVSEAMGTVDTLKGTSMAIQDISFNVVDPDSEASTLVKLFQNTQKVVRKEGKQRIVAFGPETYDSPKGFIPGVSSFYEDGGHASVTFLGSKSDKDGNIEIFEEGNGLANMRFGSEVIRISKAIESGARVKYGYGWVDLDTPEGLPVQVVVGQRRDPFTAIELRVTDVKQTQQFLMESLGMQQLAYDDILARTKGSQFEPDQPKGSVVMGYGRDTVALILLEPEQNERKQKIPVKVGTVLQAISIVLDDSSSATNVPDVAKSAMNTETYVKSPDGYPFKIVSRTAFEKVASKTAQEYKL